MIVITAKDITAEDRRRWSGQAAKILQTGATSRDELVRAGDSHRSRGK